MRNFTLKTLIVLSYVISQFCAASAEDSSSPEPPQRPHTDCQAPLVLWTGVDQEETKKQVCLLEPSPRRFVPVSGLKGIERGGRCWLREEQP